MADFTPVLVILGVAALVLGLLFAAGLALVVIGLVKKRPALWISGVAAVAVALVGSLGASLLVLG